jgi:serine/threonine protein kinase
VLLDKKGRIKIADFGLAKILGVAPQDIRLTGERDIMGTPHYMAPEQMDRPQQVDHRADIYSLGVVFYEMLTGELPLGKFAPPSQKAQIDVRLDEVVLRALENRPERRYQHASEIKTDVETIAGAAGQKVAAPGSRPVATEEEQIRRQVSWPATGLLATGVLNWVLLPIVIFLLMPPLSRKAMEHFPPFPKYVAFMLLLTPFVMCSFTIVAALRMRRLEGYSAAIIASILAMFVTPGNVIGFPIGVWSLVVLSRREVRQEFQKHKAAASPSQVSNINKGLRPIAVVAMVAVASGVLLMIWTSLRRSSISDAQPRAVKVVHAFATNDTPISHDLVPEDGGWSVSCTSTQVFRLFEVRNPITRALLQRLAAPEEGQRKQFPNFLSPGVVTYRAKLKSEDFVGRAYLEMWCEFTGKGEAFSRGLDNPLTGSNDWAAYQTPFFLRAGEEPEFIRLNLVVEGKGKVFIKDIQLLCGPLP